MRQYTDQRNPEQVIHRFRDLPEPVKQLLLHIFAFRMGFHAGNPLVNIQLLLLVDNIRGRDKRIRLQLHRGGEIHNRKLALQILHRFIEHFAIKIVAYRLHMAMLLPS